MLSHDASGGSLRVERHNSLGSAGFSASDTHYGSQTKAMATSTSAMGGSCGTAPLAVPVQAPERTHYDCSPSSPVQVTDGNTTVSVHTGSRRIRSPPVPSISIPGGGGGARYPTGSNCSTPHVRSPLGRDPYGSLGNYGSAPQFAGASLQPHHQQQQQQQHLSQHSPTTGIAGGNFSAPTANAFGIPSMMRPGSYSPHQTPPAAGGNGTPTGRSSYGSPYGSQTQNSLLYSGSGGGYEPGAHHQQQQQQQHSYGSRGPSSPLQAPGSSNDARRGSAPRVGSYPHNSANHHKSGNASGAVYRPTGSPNQATASDFYFGSAQEGPQRPQADDVSTTSTSETSSSASKGELPLCPNDDACTLINERRHQRKYAHTCRLMPCYHGHLARHTRLFRHAPNQIAKQEGVSGTTKMSAQALKSVNFSSISPEAPNAYRIYVCHHDRSYEIFGDWASVKVHTFKRYLHQVYHVAPMSQVLIASKTGKVMDDDISCVKEYGIEEDSVILLKLDTEMEEEDGKGKTISIADL